MGYPGGKIGYIKKNCNREKTSTFLKNSIFYLFSFLFSYLYIFFRNKGIISKYFVCQSCRACDQVVLYLKGLYTLF